MADYLIKDTTLTGIADAIRGKTGGTDPIMVSDFASQISGISGGGGSVEGVHYVTFMSEDGTEELYKRPVADGDDCADPVERGLISAPTKESTAQYDYSFVGWATTPNGAWDENALKAVTEDKTVYAAFAAALRYYTITYYDDDGTTVLNTERLAYGSTPSYTPGKSGYVFDGWQTELTPVEGDASYIATWSNSIASGTFTSGAEWALTADYKLVISGVGAMDAYSSTNQPWAGYKDKITSLEIMDGVTNVGAYALYGCTNLSSFTLPESVTAIGNSAFYDCKSLTTATIPGGVTSIGQYAFYGCTNLKNVTFTDTTTWYRGTKAGATTYTMDVTVTATNANRLRETYAGNYWTKV